jgi:diguanylate cyclase (GGDEF)-like protein/PAS domain S-box-containing protein
MERLADIFLPLDDFSEIVYESISACYLVNKDRKILYWNRKAADVSGYAESEILNRHCYDDILDHRDFSGVKLCTGEDLCPLVVSVQTGSIVQKSVLMRAKSGIRIPVNVKVIPIIYRDEPIGVIEFFEVETDALRAGRLFEEILRTALTDPMLGILNRLAVLEEAKKAVSAKKNYGIDSTLIFIDIDDFKKINDTYGHIKGDEVLRKLSEIFSYGIRKNDAVGRIGGEEFLIVSYGAKAEEALSIAERLRTMVETSDILPVKVTISLGVTPVKEGDTVETAVERADKAMYMSKAKGKNTTTLLL